MSTKRATVKSKLLKFREWLTLKDTAKYLSVMFEEEVNEADVLRLALDGHLKLSVNFVNQAHGKLGKLISYNDEENLPPVLRPSFFAELPEAERGRLLSSIIAMGHFIDQFLDLDDKLTTIKGVWDLSMVCGQQYLIENEYQRLTGGPEVISPIIGGCFVVREGGEVCLLHERFDEEFIKRQNSEESKQESLDYYGKVLEKRISNNEINEEEAKKLLSQREKNLSRKRSYEDDYFPAGIKLPDDSVLVVRTKALFELQERIFSEQAPISAKHEAQVDADILDTSHVFYAQELKIAVEAWIELYKKNPPPHVPQGGHKKYIEKWLVENYPILSNRARERIATIVNPNSKGGASPIE